MNEKARQSTMNTSTTATSRSSHKHHPGHCTPPSDGGVPEIRGTYVVADGLVFGGLTPNADSLAFLRERN